MGLESPAHCHRCGATLEAVDPPSRYHCVACDAPVTHHPIPTTRIAIVDEAAILLVRVDEPSQVLWGTPGGLVEAGEDPDLGAARELEEETTLEVDPTDLVLFDARTFAKFGHMHKTYLAYAVDAVDVRGTPTAADEVVDVRYWTPDAFEESAASLLTSWPKDYRDLTWWIDRAHEALDRA